MSPGAPRRRNGFRPFKDGTAQHVICIELALVILIDCEPDTPWGSSAFVLDEIEGRNAYWEYLHFHIYRVTFLGAHISFNIAL